VIGLRRRAGSVTAESSRGTWLLGAMLVAWMLSACQSLPPAPVAEGPTLSGRLAVRVEGDAQRSFSAAFELRGRAEAGSMSLISPLGSQIGRADWSPSLGVQLHDGDGTRRYERLDDMAIDLTGQALPIAALFDWLRGRPWSGAPHDELAGGGHIGFRQLGWDVQLDRLAEGWLVAVRDTPPPRVTVRTKLDDAP
jgi:outer membrane lipoprotein LolB